MDINKLGLPVLKLWELIEILKEKDIVEIRLFVLRNIGLLGSRIFYNVAFDDFHRIFGKCYTINKSNKETLEYYMIPVNPDALSEVFLKEMETGGIFSGY